MEQSIRLHYASEGFLQVQVKRPQVEYLSGTGELKVTIPIEEGPRALVESIVLPADAAGKTESGEIELGLREGEPFRLEKYVEDRNTLSAHYRREGFADSKVIGMLKPVDDRIAVSFEVDRGSQARVGDIKIARPGKTREGLIEKGLTLEEGDLILPSEIALSRKRLLDSRVLQSVDIRPVPSEKGPDVQDLVVDYVEKPDITLDYGLRLSLEREPSGIEILPIEEYSPFQVGGRLQFLNPFGYGHRYGFSGYVFGKQQFFRALFESEYFFRFRIPTQIYFSADRTRRLEVSGLEAQIQRITFQQYYRWGESIDWLRQGEKLRLQWNYSLRHIVLTPISKEGSSYAADTDRGSISLALIGDTRNNFVDPSKGLFWSVSTEFSRTWLASDVNYNKIYGQAFFYLPLGEKTVLATGLRLGIVPGENEAFIIEDRFKAGGPDSVRGFRLNSLGPKNELGEPLGGQAVAIFNMELRFPIYKSFCGGIFYDAGNAFALAKEMSLKGLRHSAGMGLRFMLPFGPIRLDWAFVIDPQPGESRSRLVFSLGHAF
jgi:outer membrane protein insertion porin family